MNNKSILQKYKTLILITLLFSGGFAPVNSTAANIQKYKISDIPEELKKGAIAVVRNDETVFVRKSLTEAVYKVTEVITILNKKALSYSNLKVQYSKYTKVKNIKANIYDQYGNFVKKISKSDIKDISAISQSTLFSDARVKYINPEYRKIPFTVEYSYEVVYSGILGTPDWYIYPGYKISVENSSFTVTTPQDMQLRYKSVNLNLEPAISKDKDLTTYTWKAYNLAAIKHEKYSLPFYENSPVLLTAPSDFSIEDVNGNSEDWESFGKWISTLNKGRTELPDETKLEIQSIYNDSLSTYENAKNLYHWMQDKTRYVSIQEGVGCWQPMLAEEVDKFSYGDCKALTNYMKSILESVGIKSNYTLVYSGKSSSHILTEFPSNQFDHVILCLPIENDTVWLECTSQQIPFGFLGNFTDDRDVLVITDDGGIIAHTKAYNKDENYKKTVATVTINEDGDGIAKINISNNGLFYFDMMHIMHSSEKDRNNMVINNINISSFDLDKYSFEEVKNIIPTVNEDVELSINNYATKLGSRLLFDVNLYSKKNYKFKRSKKRKNDIYVRREYRETDTIFYNMPDNYIAESIPANTEIESIFGKYTSEYETDSSGLTYVRRFEFNKGIYPKDDFASFKKFLTDVSKADNQKAVFILDDKK